MARRHRRRRKSGHAWPWLLLLAMACFGIGRQLIVNSEVRTSPAEATGPSAPLSNGERESAVKSIAEAFLAAPDWRARMPFLKDAERVRPMVEDFHLGQGQPDLAPGARLGKIVDSGLVDRIVCYAVFIEPGGRSRAAAFQWTEGGFRLDWESFSAYGTLAWGKVLREKPEDQQTLRVYLEDVPLLPEALRPAVPRSWSRVALSHRDSPESLDAWVADPGVASEAAGLLRTKGKVPVTVQLAFQRFGTGKEAVLQDILHAKWSQ